MRIGFFQKKFLHISSKLQFNSMLPTFFVVFGIKHFPSFSQEKFAIFTLKMAFLDPKIKHETLPKPDFCLLDTDTSL